MMTNRYYLMNKNEKLLEFEINESPLGEEITPIRTFATQLPPWMTDISTWIAQRNYAKHKEHLKRWLKTWGIDTTQGFLNITHGLGLNDSLWVKNTSETLNWENANLYTNDFSDVAEHTAFGTGLNGLALSSTNITSPEFAMEGTAPKCWKKENNIIHLYKSQLSGAKNRGLEANAEYLSANIARQIVGDESIPYDLVMFKDRLCSRCELFTTENIGYLPMSALFPLHQPHTLASALTFCKELGYEDNFRKMILIDSVVCNQDRHFGNFGVLVDNNTYQIIGFAPLFDYNLSMLYAALPEDINTIEDYKSYVDTYLVGHRMGGTFSEVGKAILTPKLKAILPKTLTLPHHQKYNLPDDRMERLLDILNYQMDQITGTRLYQIKYDPSKAAPEQEIRSEYDT